MRSSPAASRMTRHGLKLLLDYRDRSVAHGDTAAGISRTQLSESLRQLHTEAYNIWKGSSGSGRSSSPDTSDGLRARSERSGRRSAPRK